MYEEVGREGIEEARRGREKEAVEEVDEALPAGSKAHPASQRCSFLRGSPSLLGGHRSLSSKFRRRIRRRRLPIVMRR